MRSLGRAVFDVRGFRALFAVVCKKDGLYLMKQVDGMWEFPVFPDLPPGTLRKSGVCRHTITHHRLDVSVYEGEFVSGCEWKDPMSVPMSSLTRKILTTPL